MLKLAIVLIFGCALSFAASDSDRPVCNKKNVGELWPPEAKTDRVAFWRFSQSGELEVCSRGTWHYRWQGLTVNVRDLAAPRPSQHETGKDAKPFAAASSQSQEDETSTK
jgi:hypothetical protein